MTPFKETMVGAHLGQSTRGHHLPFNCWGENSTHQIESTSCCWNSLCQWKTRPLGQEEEFEWYQKWIAILGPWHEGTRATAKTNPHQDSFPQLIHLERQATLRINQWFTCTISKIFVQTPCIHQHIYSKHHYFMFLIFFWLQSDPAEKENPHIPPWDENEKQLHLGFSLRHWYQQYVVLLGAPQLSFEVSMICWWFQPLLKHISQNGNLPQTGMKVKNNWVATT